MSTIAPTQPATAPAILPGTHRPSPSAPDLYRFTVDQYKRMGAAGILTEDDRVELVEGLLYRKPMKKGPHSISRRETTSALTRVVPAEVYFVTREDPVNIPGRSGMPEPDISVVRGRSRDYVEQPKAGDVPMVVEVADKGRLAYDRGEKLGSYAEGGIPCTGSSTSSIVRSRSTPTRARPAIGRAWTSSPANASPSSSTARPSARSPSMTCCRD